MATSRQDGLKHLAVAGILIILIYYMTLYLPLNDDRDSLLGTGRWDLSAFQDDTASIRHEENSAIDSMTVPEWQQPNDHPISELRDAAYERLTLWLERRSTNLEQAAKQYRERRGRHPPPGFDAWYAAAERMDSVVIEDFFDQIYHDLGPFWAKDPMEMRRRARTQPQRIQVRKGRASFVADWTGYPDFAKRTDWMELWTGAVREISQHLPDLDMVVNVMDESRTLVPWEDIEQYTAVERDSRQLLPAEDAVPQYTEYSGRDAEPLNSYRPEWITDHADRYWEYVKTSCSPDSPARQGNNSAISLSPDDSIEDIYPSSPSPSYSHHGFISNFTTSQDACQQPWLRGLHGTYVEPGAMSTLTSLDFPMFGGSKLPQNNGILLPGAMYLTDEARYSGGGSHGGSWNQKKDGLVWRGVSSGGHSTADNWWRFHRHRFVQMLNGSAVSLLEDGPGTTDRRMTFHLSHDAEDNTSKDTTLSKGDAHLGASLDDFADVGFVAMDCHPSEYSFWGRRLETCPYTDDYYTLKPEMSMTQQYDFKFLPDVDGNSFSARWRAFMLSSSLPLKATVYTEWHDHRLIPWLHFVPFDNTFADIYPILDYFRKHDAEAKRIAEEGQAWAKRVLRREDMVLYIWRLLLEYARVMDPNRDKLAYVDDVTFKL